MLELNKIYNCNCLEGLKQLDDNSIDLTVTSPPYDNLRTYSDKNTGDECVWNFEIFKPIAQELYRVTKKGGVVVWVVGDACIDNGETGSSFRQALYFQELGFKIHDTMIYEKNSSSFPAKLSSKRYSQIFEYMFVFSKGKIRGDIKLIADKRNKWAGWTNWGEHSQYDAEGNLIKTQNIKPIAEFSLRTNIWRYPVSFNDKTGHPAVFPEKLAEDHILSWSNEGETVLDPFMGSGTTAKMAMMNHRNFVGFELNTGYYDGSLNRTAKYEGKYNDKVISVPTSKLTNVEDIDTDEIQANPVDDKDFDKKVVLWKELTAELEDYFNTQSLGILKNLKVNLTFASKANDKRVEKVLQERGCVSDTTEPVKEDTPDKSKITIEERAAPKAMYVTPSISIIDKGKKAPFVLHIETEDMPQEISSEKRTDEPILSQNEPISAENEPIQTKKKRGRPAGSKNKKKEENKEDKNIDVMENKTIEKTSNEEGKYAEYVVEYLSKETGTRYEDVSNNPEYQKLDIDALINGAKVEIKNDTIIHSSGNAVYEKNTHVRTEQINKVKALKESKTEITFDELPSEYGSIGCNEKCNADKIFYVSTIESNDNPKHYRINWKEPAFIIDNKKFKDYVRRISIPTSSVKTPYHREDYVYNVIICFKINELISAGVARRINSYTLSVLKNKFDVFNEFHTSDEIKKLLLGK